MNKVIVSKTRYKRPLIKRINEGCLYLRRREIHIFKNVPILFPPYSLHQTLRDKIPNIWVHDIATQIINQEPSLVNPLNPKHPKNKTP